MAKNPAQSPTSTILIKQSKTGEPCEVILIKQSKTGEPCAVKCAGLGSRQLEATGPISTSLVKIKQINTYRWKMRRGELGKLAT